MYWQVGEFLSNESKNASFGDAYIDAIASEIQDLSGCKTDTEREFYIRLCIKEKDGMKKLRKLDAKTSQKTTVIAIVLGVIGALILGSGMRI